MNHAEEARAFLALPREARHRERLRRLNAGKTLPLTAAYEAGVFDSEGLERFAEARNSHPAVLPHAVTVEECDELCAKAEADVAIHLPTYAASRTTWTLPRGATQLEDLPAPTQAQLERHRLRYGPDCVDLASEKRDAKTLRAEGKSVPEIARLLRVTERAVKARLRSGEATPIPAV